MLRILNDTCIHIKKHIAEREYILQHIKTNAVAEVIRYDIEKAKAKLKHYETMYKEYAKSGYIDNKEQMEIELDEKLQQIEIRYRGVEELFDDEE